MKTHSWENTIRIFKTKPNQIVVVVVVVIGKITSINGSVVCFDQLPNPT